MNPYRVTITGADDAVDPDALLALTREFPFVEWGMLFSRKRAGTPRYPSTRWIADLLIGAYISETPVSLSAHLCGAVARDAMVGTVSEALKENNPWRRIQINGFVPPTTRELHRLATNATITFILQCRSEDTLQETARAAEMLPGASVLFDVSGGTGKEPLRWPTTPFGCRLGFAGGINPDNVVDVIRDIGPRDPYWIDMESGVRTNDALDLAKVRRVLEQFASIGGSR